ncbi:Mss4-like protein [Biscogniauxia marginata]|nr:Mss4-like protein [Biscogniauxia marginata]
MEARCQCGAVQFRTPLPKPLALYICHCAECRRQTGSAFGTSAIFPHFPLPQSELLSCYTYVLRKAKGKNVVSVKGGCIEGLDWGRAIHIWTKSAMVPIPEGSEAHSEEPADDSEYGDSQESLDQPPADAPGLLVGSGGRAPSSPPSSSSSADPDELERLRRVRVRGACELSGVI